MPDPITDPGRTMADAKAWFYLDHRGDIEAWAALRAEGRGLLDAQLVSLAESVAELAERWEAVFETADLASGSWPRMGLRREAWQQEGTADVSIVIQWERARLLTPGPNEWPFVAVRVPRSQGDEARRDELSAVIAPVRALLKAQRTYVWPLWRYVRPGTGDSLDPRELLAGVLGDFEQLWQQIAPALDDLHRPILGVGLA